MAFIYLLENIEGTHRYLGSTNDVEKRLLEHNSGSTKATKYKGPWKLLHYWEFFDIAHARSIEQTLKRMKKKLRIDYITYFIEKEIR